MADTITKPDGSFMNEEEIAEHVFRTLPAKAKPSWLRVSRARLIREHHGIGMAMRNLYGMWDPMNKQFHPDPVHYNFPDQVSMRVIEKVWEKIRNEYTASGPRFMEGLIQLPADSGVRMWHNIGEGAPNDQAG